MAILHIPVNPTFDRNWLVQNAPIEAFTEELDADGNWVVTTIYPEQVIAAVDNYPVDYLPIARASAKNQIEARASAAFQGGFKPTTPSLTGHVLQCRDIEDRTNWLTSQVSYSAAISAGAGAVVGASFRTAANVTVTTTYQEGSDVLLAMAQWGADIMARAWALKDAAAAAADIFELDAVLAELDAGWPV